MKVNRCINAGRFEIFASAVLCKRAMRLATSTCVAHLLGFSEIFVRPIVDPRVHPDHEFLRWWSESRCAIEYDNLARPDLHGIWRDYERRGGFYLEYETGTEPLQRPVESLGGYADLATAGIPGRPVLSRRSFGSSKRGLTRQLLPPRQGPAGDDHVPRARRRACRWGCEPGLHR